MSAGCFAGQSIDAVRRKLATMLDSNAIDSPDLDARLLAGAVLGLDLTGLIRESARTMTHSEAARLDALAQRRMAGEPTARILGNAEFWGLSLHLSVDTLIPRPDTETVVEAALEHLGVTLQKAPLQIADLGTGSGAILLALLSELPCAFGVATDISLAALHTARRNAMQCGLGARARFIACNYASALAEGFDLIVSNPPYIRSAEIAHLGPEVRDYDPHCALDGGVDGLAAYRIIAAQANRLLLPGGALVVEVGHDQSAEVSALMVAQGLTLSGPARVDLAGIDRAIVACRLR